MASNSRRLSILTAQEVDDLYSLPRFTEDDRHLYFDLSPAEREHIDPKIAGAGGGTELIDGGDTVQAIVVRDDGGVLGVGIEVGRDRLGESGCCAAQDHF